MTIQFAWARVLDAPTFRFRSVRKMGNSFVKLPAMEKTWRYVCTMTTQPNENTRRPWRQVRLSLAGGSVLIILLPLTVGLNASKHLSQNPEKSDDKSGVKKIFNIQVEKMYRWNIYICQRPSPSFFPWIGFSFCKFFVPFSINSWPFSCPIEIVRSWFRFLSTKSLVFSLLFDTLEDSMSPTGENDLYSYTVEQIIKINIAPPMALKWQFNRFIKKQSL